MIPATLPPEFGNVAQKKQLKLWFFALLRTFLNCQVVFRNIFVNWYEARRQIANHGSYGLVDVGVVPNLTYTLWCFHSPRLAIEENTVHLQRSEVLLAALVKHLLLGITDMNPNITSHHFASMPRIHVYLKDFISAMIFPATKSLNYGIRHLFEDIRLSRHVNSVAAFSGASDSGVATFWHYRKRGLLSSSFSPPLLLSSSLVLFSFSFSSSRHLALESWSRPWRQPPRLASWRWATRARKSVQHQTRDILPGTGCRQKLPACWRKLREAKGHRNKSFQTLESHTWTWISHCSSMAPPNLRRPTSILSSSWDFWKVHVLYFKITPSNQLLRFTSCWWVLPVFFSVPDSHSYQSHEAKEMSKYTCYGVR